MRRLVAAVLPAFFPLLLYAQDRDPLASPECRAARAELEQALNDPADSRSRPGDRLARARENAAAACLGGTDGERERSGAPQPVQVVPPPLATQARPPSLPEPAPPSAPLAIPRPTAITSCDPAGCWDSEGRRLNNMGPLLMGPHGLCSVQGGMVSCP
jgi:hypothetical protein